MVNKEVFDSFGRLHVAEVMVGKTEAKLQCRNRESPYQITRVLSGASTLFSKDKKCQHCFKKG